MLRGVRSLLDSNYLFDKFVEMLKAHAVQLIVDVHTIPRSRHNPQFNTDIITAALKAHGNDYHHLPALGGLRHPRKDSLNSGWENDSFRGFADYMQTEGFASGLSELLEMGRASRTAVVCAGALPWCCHRSLIADAMLVRGITAMHIIDRSLTKEHAVTPWAKVAGTTITYPRK